MGETFKRKTPYLSVIVPAYNEEERIVPTLESIWAYLSRQDYGYEVIVVNDGSRDNTAEVVSRLIPRMPGLRVIDYDENRGKGWAVRKGMLCACGEIRLFMDADNSTTVDQFERMLPYFAEGYDIVIGSRRIEGAVIAVRQSWLRENIGRLFNLVARLLSGIPMNDTQAGFKAFTAKAAEQTFPLQTIWHWSFDVELLTIAIKRGFRIKEVPIRWENDERSHVALRSAAKVLLDLIRIRINSWRGLYDR